MIPEENNDTIVEKSKLKEFFFGLLDGIRKKNPDTEEPPATDELADGEQQEQGEAEELDPNQVPAVGNPLYELYNTWLGNPAPEEGDTFHLSIFIDQKENPEKEKCGWLKSFEGEARTILHKIQEADKRSREAELAELDPDAPTPEEVIEPPIDAKAYVKVATDRMSGWVFILPPFFGGEHYTPEELTDIVKKNNLTYGIKEEAVAEICQSLGYFTLYQVAWGLPAEDGVDGSIVDYFHREVEIRLTVKEDNTIDYKDLGWLQTVLVDQEICRIIPPTDAIPGMNVLGNEVRGRNGRKAAPPKGQNTRVNEEGLALIATIDGVLSFVAGRFQVDPLLIIRGDVDNAVGNLDVVGDLLIDGDILEGYTVQATGNITVQGMIEGAQVQAGRDVQVGCGMNGNSHGMLEAKGEIRCKFIENGTATAGQKVVCDTIINSTISSDDAIEVKTGRGAIIGGNITALKSITALSIGNQSNRNMVITMGSTANFLREKRELEEKLKEAEASLQEIAKNIMYLTPAIKEGVPSVIKMLDDLNLKQTVQKMQQANLERQFVIMEKKATDNTVCRIRADVLYPPAQITIGSFTKIVRETAFNAVCYLKEGEIRIANIYALSKEEEEEKNRDKEVDET